MTDREKLIELMIQAKTDCMNKDCNDCEYDSIPSGCHMRKYADYILADGWIRPPCKVGEYVYKINTAFNYVLKCKVVGFHLGDFPTLRGQKRKEYFVCYSDYYLYHIPFDDLGKTVFFSYDEAMKVLEERK